jgi:hypothetical protein
VVEPRPSGWDRVPGRGCPRDHATAGRRARGRAPEVPEPTDGPSPTRLSLAARGTVYLRCSAGPEEGLPAV